MKIRNGFVANSSSSSFVVPFKKITTLQVAKHMVNVVHRDNNNWNKNTSSSIKENLKALVEDCKSKKISDPPIMFGSCNYDTKIIKYKGRIFVTTSNNHSWEDDPWILKYCKCLGEGDGLMYAMMEGIMIWM